MVRRNGIRMRKENDLKKYITTYALTRGILEIETDTDSRYTEYAYDNGKVYLKKLGKRNLEPCDIHDIKEKAIERAKRMRDNKILFYEKQIEKLRKMQFDE